MTNDTLCNLIWVLISWVIITEVTAKSLSPNTTTVNNNNSNNNNITITTTDNNNHDLIATPQMPKNSVTEIFSIASSTPDYPKDKEQQVADKDDSTIPTDIPTTLGSSLTSTLPPAIRRGSPKAAECPVNVKAGTLVKCRCKGDEILVDDQCQYYPNGTIYILAQRDFMNSVEVPVTNYKVIIREVKCDSGKSRLLQFTKGQFQLRSHGNLILLESAGDLHGQRIDKYCISHHMDYYGNLAVTMKACIPTPAVPRCCPSGQAMKDGSCQPASTPDFLTPPITAKPFYRSVEWPVITNNLSPLTCTIDPVKTIPLSYKASHLVSLAGGLELVWISDVRPIYYSYPDYCIDGINNVNGSVSYFTSFCYSKPKEHHERVCTGRPCVRKCCKWGQVMDVNRYSCVPVSNASFNPPTVEALTNYNIVIDWPLCTPPSRTNGTISIDESGLLIYNDRAFPATDYCVDTFVNDDTCELSALACQSVTNLWQEIRRVLFPVCNIISLFFLGINIVCHLVVPKLRTNGGVYQLCHSIALSIAYLFSVIANLSNNYLTLMSCFPIAIMMQYGYLAAFFWLNVMCFEIWRKIRRLIKFQPCKPYLNRYCMMYTWGIPFVICVTTILMQFLAPENVPWLIKPYIGYSTCWFRDEIPLLIYFYGPIAVLFVCNIVFLGLTSYNYFFVLQNIHKDTTKILHQMDIRVNSGSASSPPQNSTSNTQSEQPMRNFVQSFKQQFLLFLLISTCWVTEILSWKIPPPEIWAVTDTLNCLQGLFIFLILLSNGNKYRQIKEQCPHPLQLAQKCIKVPSKIKRFCPPINSISPTISKKFSSSTIELTSISMFPSLSSLSNNVSAPSLEAPISVHLDDSKNGIISRSYLPIQISKSSNSDRTTSQD